MIALWDYGLHRLPLAPYVPKGSGISQRHGDGSERMACPKCLEGFRAFLREARVISKAGKSDQAQARSAPTAT